MHDQIGRLPLKLWVLQANPLSFFRSLLIDFYLMTTRCIDTCIHVFINRGWIYIFFVKTKWKPKDVYGLSRLE